MTESSRDMSRRGFMKRSAAVAGGAALDRAATARATEGGGTGGSSSASGARATPGFPYVIDDRGPKGIALSSWLDKERLGLVLNDFQNFCILEKYGFTNDYNQPRYANIVLPNTLRLVDRFRDLGRPIVYTILATRHEQFLDLPGACRKVLARDLKMSDGTRYHLRFDDEGSRPPDELTPKPEDIVIIKTSSGAFNSSDIDNVLRNNGISSLVFTGGISELCLSSTVRGAYDCGYLCTVAEDATITGSAEHQHWAMAFLGGSYAWVTSTGEILKHLS